MLIPVKVRKLGRQAGVSLVELMVGVTVGLFIVAGSITLFVSLLNNSRNLLVQARVNQDLRGAADTIARELRRGGYWENAIAGTVTDSTGATTSANPNSAVTFDASTSSIRYSIARDTAVVQTPVRTANNNTLESDEQFGFKLSSGQLQMEIGSGNWQSITDPNITTVNYFKLTPTVTAVDIKASCAKACCDAIAGSCTATNVTACPKATVRQYTLLINGQATSDSAVNRTLAENIRIRNDLVTGGCPT